MKQLKRTLGVLLAFAFCMAAMTGCMVRQIPVEPGPKPDQKNVSSVTEPLPRTTPPEMPITTTDPPKEPEKSPSLLGLQHDIQASSCIAGVALLGFSDSVLPQEYITLLVNGTDYEEKYPFLAEIPDEQVIDCAGTEVYAIVPVDDTWAITIYPVGMASTGESLVDWSNPIFQGEPGDPVIIRCNVSDLFANTLISMTDGPNSFEFSPTLSLDDGHLSDCDGCLDFSIYESLYAVDGQVDEAFEWLLCTAEVQLGIDQGMDVFFLGDRIIIDSEEYLLFYMGFNEDDALETGKTYAVQPPKILVYQPETDSWIPVTDDLQ